MKESSFSSHADISGRETPDLGRLSEILIIRCHKSTNSFFCHCDY